MTRRARLILMILWCPVVAAAAAPVQQTVQPGVAAPQVVLPPIPPGNVLFRLNGTRAITERVFPTLVNASRALNQDIPSITFLDDKEAGLGEPPLLGVKVDTWATDVKLRVPVGSDDWTANFRGAGAQRARVESTFAFSDASLDLKLHIRTQPITPIGQLLPDWVKRMASLNETFTVGLAGFGGALHVVLKRAGNGVAVDSADGFALNVGNVTVSEAGWLTEIASFVLGFDKLFNVVGATDANQAAKLILNRVLREDLGIQALIKEQANAALRSFDTQQFLNQELAIGSGALLLLAPTFERLESANNWMISEWALGLNAKPDDKVPGLERRRGLVPAESPTATPPAGDLQAFVPYSLVDHTFYELIQAGLLRDFTIPAASAGGVGNGFRMHLVPTETPRLRRDPSGTAQLVLEFAARMEDATVGTTQLAPTADMPARVPITRVPLDISTLNATAAVSVFVNLIVNNASGIALDVTGVRLENLSGQLRVAMVTTELAPHRQALQNVITTAVRNRTPPQPLITRSVGISPPLRAVVGQPSYGPAYIRLPIDIVVQ